MGTFLIVVEAIGAGSAYHYQPYRIASTPRETFELMREYLRLGPDSGALVPDYFAVYREKDGEFGAPEYFDGMTFEPTDATEWLQRTGRL
jgi:hypothetical protein